MIFSCIVLATTSTAPLTMSIEFIVEGGRPEDVDEYEIAWIMM